MERTQQVANALVAACLAGADAIDEMQLRYYAVDAVSVEPFANGPGGAESHGLAAIRAKNKHWYETHELHTFEVEGPFVHGNKFSVIFNMDVTARNDVAPRHMKIREIALYTTLDGTITREEFFGPPML